MCRYILFAGANGAGKTTLYQSNPKIQTMPRVNLDETVRSFGSWENADDVARAGKIAVQAIKQYFSSRTSFNQETTLCGNSIVKNIVIARELGYSVEMYYVGLDSADLAVERVRNRVKNGGHGIPEKDIRKRYDTSLAQLKKVLAYCTKVELYDNSSIFRRIAIYEESEWNIMSGNIPAWCKKVIGEGKDS